MGNGKMGRDTGRFREEIIEALIGAGALKAGCAPAGEIAAEEYGRYCNWIQFGKNGGMDYLSRHQELRKHTDNVLPGAKTVISMAFSYVPEKWRNPALPKIAAYAYGKDYHEVIRQRLQPLLREFKEKYGGVWRLCIDSAPVAEKYWAQKCGIGEVGKNGLIFTDKAGSLCVLAEILTTLVLCENNEEIERKSSSKIDCSDCDACIRNCPGQALSENGLLDARRCINYLTIEHRGEWDEEQKEILRKARSPLFGCDICIRVCPRNRDIKPTNIPEFQALKDVVNLDRGELEKIDEREFKLIFKESPIKRMTFDGLKRWEEL